MLGWSQFPAGTSGSCCLPRCMCDTWTGCSHSPHQKWAPHRAGGKTGPSFSFLEHLCGLSRPEHSSSKGCRDPKGLHMMECKCTYRELVTNKKFIYVLEQTLRYLPSTANRFPALLFKKAKTQSSEVDALRVRPTLTYCAQSGRDKQLPEPCCNMQVLESKLY